MRFRGSLFIYFQRNPPDDWTPENVKGHCTFHKLSQVPRNCEASNIKLSSDRGGQGGQKNPRVGWLVLMKFHEKNTIEQLEDTEPIVELGRTWYTVVITHLLSGMQTAVFVASDLCISPSLAQPGCLWRYGPAPCGNFRSYRGVGIQVPGLSCCAPSYWSRKT